MAVEMKFGDYVKGGVEVFTKNVVPCIVFWVVLLIPVVGWVAAVNYMAAVKAFKTEQKPIDIGALFDFGGLVDKIVTVILMAIGFQIFFIPGCLIAFGPCIVADKPGTPFMKAVMGALNFSLKNLVPMIICGIVCGIASIVAPIGMAAFMLAYLDHKDAVAAAA